jgi:hypothetical protein
MNRLLRAACLGTAVIALAWLPRVALASDLVAVKAITVSDAVSGPAGKLFAGRKLNITCHYDYKSLFKGKPVGWKLRLEVDGKLIASPDASPPGSGLAFDPATKQTYTKLPSFHATATWTAAAAGDHLARCVLDPDAKLAALESQYDRKNNVMERKFTVDVMPAYGPGEATTKGAGVLTVPPGKGKGLAQAPGTVAQGAQPVVLNPDLRLSLTAQVLTNCGKGQDVVRVSGSVRNVGSGHAIIPAGKPLIKIEAAAGVNGGTITVGNLAPGQGQPISLVLKPKAMPESLAGAKLTLKASIIQGVIKESSYAGNEQDLTVVFPANYCKQGSTQPRAAPGGPATSR